MNTSVSTLSVISNTLIHRQPSHQECDNPPSPKSSIVLHNFSPQESDII